MSIDVLLAGIAALAFSALQLFLLRRVILTRSSGVRMALLAVKVPLWALALIGAYTLCSQEALLAFGLIAGAVYPAASIVYYFRTRKGE